MLSTSRRLGPWLLALAFAAPAPAAALPAFDPGALLDRLRGLFSVIWAENGCDFDPNGKCGSALHSPPTLPNGCDFDSNGGKCAPSPATRFGCDVDPDGVHHCAQ